MLDTVTAYRSGLERVLNALFDDPAREEHLLTQRLGIDSSLFRGWMQGRDIPESTRFDLASIYHVDPTCFEPHFADEDRPIRVPGRHPSGSRDVDGLWGDIALGSAGSEKPDRFPVSRTDVERLRAGKGEAIALRCLGGSAVVVFPGNLGAMALTAAGRNADQTMREGNPFDPACGLSPEILLAAGRFDHNLHDLDRHEAFLPEVTENRTSHRFSRYMADAIADLGGEDAVLRFLNGVEIRFRDGSSEKVHVETDDPTPRSLFAKVLLTGKADHLVCVREGSVRFFPKQDIAWIRIPAFHVSGYIEIEG